MWCSFLGWLIGKLTLIVHWSWKTPLCACCLSLLIDDCCQPGLIIRYVLPKLLNVILLHLLSVFFASTDCSAPAILKLSVYNTWHKGSKNSGLTAPASLHTVCNTSPAAFLVIPHHRELRASLSTAQRAHLSKAPTLRIFYFSSPINKVQLDHHSIGSLFYVTNVVSQFPTALSRRVRFYVWSFVIPF
jgi:hypothetical protein